MRPSNRTAFSLVELLVVIGIIALLVGILVPTVSRMRSTANVTKSRQIISTLSSAIERYQSDFRAYPGLFSNDQITARGQKYMVATPPVAGALTGATGADITSSENLVLSLMGGVDFNVPTAPTSIVFADVNVGKGARKSLNPAILSNNGKLPAYVERTDAVLQSVPMVPATNDSVIPEFADGYPGELSLPVLYLRARVGATGVAGAGAGFQYNAADLLPYNFDLANAPDGEDGDTLPDFANALAYFENRKVPGTAVQKDGYILIGAGRDRKFGTKDDLTNFGSFE